MRLLLMSAGQDTGIRSFCAFSNDRQSVDARLNIHLVLGNCGKQQGCDREKVASEHPRLPFVLYAYEFLLAQPG
jgi:hypothetical protein